MRPIHSQFQAEIDSARWSIDGKSEAFRAVVCSALARIEGHSPSCVSPAVPVLSPNFPASRFTAPEWAAAFADDPTGEQGRVVPVRVAECDPKGLLGPIVYIDLVGREEAKAKDALLRGVRRERAKPLVSPLFPGDAVPVDRSTAAVAKPARFPAVLPPIWNVPHRRNPHFTGRDELLEALHRTLTEGPTALSGMGGIGKTQLALEYAYRQHTEFDLIWWLRAEDKAILLADYAALVLDHRGYVR